MQRRYAILLLCSALVTPRAALAQNCQMDSFADIANSSGYNIAAGAIQGAVFGGLAAGAAILLSAPAGVALTVFAGVTLYTGVWPALRSNTQNSLDFIDAALGN